MSVRHLYVSPAALISRPMRRTRMEASRRRFDIPIVVIEGSDFN